MRKLINIGIPSMTFTKTSKMLTIIYVELHCTNYQHVEDFSKIVTGCLPNSQSWLLMRQIFNESFQTHHRTKRHLQPIHVIQQSGLWMVKSVQYLRLDVVLVNEIVTNLMWLTQCWMRCFCFRQHHHSYTEVLYRTRTSSLWLRFFTKSHRYFEGTRGIWC